MISGGFSKRRRCWPHRQAMRTTTTWRRSRNHSRWRAVRLALAAAVAADNNNKRRSIATTNHRQTHSARRKPVATTISSMCPQPWPLPTPACRKCTSWMAAVVAIRAARDRPSPTRPPMSSSITAIAAVAVIWRISAWCLITTMPGLIMQIMRALRAIRARVRWVVLRWLRVISKLLG